MPFANFKVPAGTLTAEQKELIVHRATDLYAEIYGERARPNTMILVEEVPDGGWGIGDQVLTLAMLQASGPQAPEPQASALQASAPAGQPDVANPPGS
jgi:4-oxalocrotonate tautomerase